MLAVSTMPTDAAARTPFSGASETAPQAAEFSFGQLLGSVFASDPVPVAKAAPKSVGIRTADDPASTPAPSNAPDVLALLMSMGALPIPPLAPAAAVTVAAGDVPSSRNTSPLRDAAPQPQPPVQAALATSTRLHSQTGAPATPGLASTLRAEANEANEAATPAATVTALPQPDTRIQTGAAEPQPLPHQPGTAPLSAPASHSRGSARGGSATRPLAPVTSGAASATPEPVKPESEVAARAKLQPPRSQTLPMLELQAPNLQAPAANPPQTGAPVPSTSAALHGSQSVTPALTHPGWNDAIAQRVLWMAQDSVQSASINLNPPNLGALQVSLQIENQQASVQFVTANTQVQQALQDALPVLRDLLAQSGIALGQADVGANQNSPKWTTLPARRSKPEAERPDAKTLTSGSAIAPRASSAGYRLVNVFA